MVESGEDLPLVDVGHYTYLVNWLIDGEKGVGPVNMDAMGNLRPIDWSDITHFRLNLQLELTVWEAETLKAMSYHYLQGYERGSDPLSRSPIDIEQQ